MFRNSMADLAYAVRMMAKKPAFSIVIMLTLALGIGATIAMFNTLNAALIRPLPYEDPHRLVLGVCTFNGEINPMASAPDYYDYRDNSKAFESLAAVLAFTRKSSVTGIKESEEVTDSVVSVDLFPTLRVRPQIGRSFTAQEEVTGAPGVAMISHGYWQRRFGGSPDAVGRIVMIDGVPHTIVGVMPAAFYFLYPIEVWRPMRPNAGFASERRYHNWLLVGRLKPGVTIKQAQSQVDVISARLERQYPDSNKGIGLLLSDLQQALADNYRSGLLLLMAAVSLVLLISCGNVASLLLARGSARRSELAVRAALGASSVRLVCQLLTESIVLAVAAGFLGVMLAIWFQRLVLELLPLGYLGVSGRRPAESRLEPGQEYPCRRACHDGVFDFEVAGGEQDHRDPPGRLCVGCTFPGCDGALWVARLLRGSATA